MFEEAIKLVKERIQILENTGKTEDEIYLGVSNICENINTAISELGWKTFYIEQGLFQLSKI